MFLPTMTAPSAPASPALRAFSINMQFPRRISTIRLRRSLLRREQACGGSAATTRPYTYDDERTKTKRLRPKPAAPTVTACSPTSGAPNSAGPPRNDDRRLLGERISTNTGSCFGSRKQFQLCMYVRKNARRVPFSNFANR